MATVCLKTNVWASFKHPSLTEDIAMARLWDIPSRSFWLTETLAMEYLASDFLPF